MNDDHIKKRTQYYEEKLAKLDKRIDRLEKYSQLLAKKVGVDLDTINI